MKAIAAIILVCVLQIAAFTQIKPVFFPEFEAYSGNPIIRYGDGFADAAWNDPCVLKQNGQYIMYMTAAKGIVLSNTNTVKVYRQVSFDGYNWTLSPSTPVLEPVSGTYYGGGTETPSVVYKDGLYHMYLTCYPPGNNPAEFVLGHATSSDGISWNMDAAPVLESDGSATFYGNLVGEPGAMVCRDSIFVFFTAAGTVNGKPTQSIGWFKSANGMQFDAPKPAVSLPLDVYPLSSDYWGLSTPSALAIKDSIYLFTDVARTINGNWTQVALHQFKTSGTSGNWFHDSKPIHTMQDFAWTDGDYLSNLLAITPLMDDNGKLRIWYSGYRLADVSGKDTTYHVVYDNEGKMHVDPGYWGIGTSSYQFALPNAIEEISLNQSIIQLNPNPAADFITIKSSTDLKGSSVNVYDITGSVIKSFDNARGNLLKLDLNEMQTGIYYIRIKSSIHHWEGKFIVSR